MNYMMMSLVAACLPPELTPEPPVCGDRIVQTFEGEECDDGRDNSDNAECTDSCTIAACGDGLVHTGVEACDNGLANAEDGACTHLCTIATCGDGYVHAGVEECDDGGGNSDIGSCTTRCATAECGDGLLQVGVEECDFGAKNRDDGVCTTDCRFNTAGCGDESIDEATEECDDGNQFGGDGCSPTCRLTQTLNVDTAASGRIAGGGGAPNSVSHAGDLNNDGRDDLLSWTPTSDTHTNVHALYGPIVGTQFVGQIGATIEGDGRIPLASGLGDLHNDGFDDFAFSIRQADGSEELIIVSGPVSGSLDSSQFDAISSDDRFTTITGAGDLNNDGLADFITTSFGNASSVVTTAPSGTTSLELARAAELTMVPSNTSFGWSSASGDVTGDGIPDVIISAPSASQVFAFGSPLADETTASAAGIVAGELSHSAGSELAVGDLNGDGIDDLVVAGVIDGGGGSSASSPYGIWVVYGPVSGTVSLANADALFTAEPGHSLFLPSVAVGDINDDGFGDLLMGSPQNGVVGADAGAAYVAFGPVQGSHSLDNADWILRGEDAGDRLGREVVLADMDGDDRDDLIIGSSNTTSGLVYVVPGHSIF